MLLLFITIMLDYILTYMGIRIYGVVEEANVLMQWLFELPLAIGLGVRALLAMLVLAPFMLLKSLDKNAYRKTLITALSINLIIIILHERWMVYLLLL